MLASFEPRAAGELPEGSVRRGTMAVVELARQL